MAISTARTELEQNADDVKNQFAAYGGSNPHFRDVVMMACDLIKQSPGTGTKGDDLIAYGVSATSKDLAEIIQGFTIGEERDNFMLIMDAFRTRAYVDARAVNPNDPIGNPSQEELHDLYVQLAAAGVNVNAANFDMYINETLIPNISEKKNISRVLVESLLNQFVTAERVHAIRDDILELNFWPVTSGISYQQYVPIRNLAYTRSLLELELAHIVGMKYQTLPELQPNHSLTRN